MRISRAAARLAQVGAAGQGGAMAAAVLRVSDQRRERTPALCVKSGEPTEAAVRVTAIAGANADKWELWLGPLAVMLARLRQQPRFEVILPVSRQSWRWVTRGRLWSVLAAGVGAALMVVSIHNGGFDTLIASWLFLVPSWLLRTRANWKRWVGVEYRPDGQDIRLTRVHPRFAEAAGDLWRKSLTHR